MATLFNTQTQGFEDLPQEQADQAVSSGTHHVPMIDKDGDMTAVPFENKQDYMAQGYREPSSEQLQGGLDQTKSEQPMELAKAYAESAAAAGTFGISTGIQTSSGISKKEDVKRRANNLEENHPLGKFISQATGLALSEATGIGEGAMLAKAGKFAEAVAGINTASTIGKMGSNAVRMAAESSMQGLGTQAEKHFYGDPVSIETALPSMGLDMVLGGALGAGFGAVSPLWKMASESKLGAILGSLKDKANGGAGALSSEMASGAIHPIDALAEKAGIEIDPAFKSALSKDPNSIEMLQHLAESNSGAGKEIRAGKDSFFQRAHDAILGALGKTSEQVDSLADMSEHEVGSKVADSLMSEIKEKSGPLSEVFDKIKEKYKSVVLTDANKDAIGEEISKFMLDRGEHLVDGTDSGSLIKKIMGSIPKINTLEDLRKVQSVLGDEIKSKNLWQLGGLRKILRESEGNIVEETLAHESPDLVPQHKAARAEYGALMDKIEGLNDQLHVGKYNGPGSFVNAIKEMNPETVLSRLTPKNRADFLSMMQEHFPQTANQIKDSYLNQALKTAGKRAIGEQSIVPKSIFDHISKWSPELRQFALPSGASERLEAIKTLMEAMPGKMNNSGTARTLDSLWSKLPGGAGAMISMAMGHNPVMGAILGQVGRYVGVDAPDALRLAFLKFMGNGSPINPGAFKTAVEAAAHTIKGESMLNKAAKSVFNAGAIALPNSVMPNDQKREKLKSKLDDLSADNSKLLNVGGNMGHYLPEHASAMGAVAVRAQQYLQTLKPVTAPTGPLDKERKPSKADVAKYNRQLDIAQQPLIAIQHVKDGTLTPKDVETVKTIYPGWYSRTVSKLTDEMINHVSKGESIPYATRLSLSLFMGQNLDSSMSQASILAAQPSQAQRQEQAEQKAQTSPHTGSLKALKTFASNQSTPQQLRQAAKASG